MGLRIAADHHHIALINFQAHPTVHLRLRGIDHRLQHLPLRRPPVAVVDQACVARHQIVLEVRDLAIEADRFDGAMGFEHDAATRRLVAAARFHSDIAIFDEVQPAHPMLTAEVVQLG